MSGVLLVLGGVAVCLPLLNADAHGKGLGLHGNAPAVQHFKGVPGRMAGTENQVLARERVGSLGAGDCDFPQRTVPDIQIGELALKAEVRPGVQ